MGPQEHPLYHRVAVVVEVDDYETSRYYLWNWAHEHCHRLVGDLRHRGVEVLAASVCLDRDLSSPNRSEEVGPGPEESQKTP